MVCHYVLPQSLASSKLSAETLPVVVCGSPHRAKPFTVKSNLAVRGPRISSALHGTIAGCVPLSP